MQKFSERKGLVEVSKTIQKEGMTDELRNSLWNILHELYWRPGKNGKPDRNLMILFLTEEFQINFLKKPIDELPSEIDGRHKIIRDYFFNCKWDKVYDFLEFVSISLQKAEAQDEIKKLTDQTNAILKRELSAYRLIGGMFVNITDEQEIEALEQALADDRFKGVQMHLKTALKMLSDREKPDYRNSIKESISAVESMCKIITGEDNSTLGDALKVLEKQGKLHKHLKDGFVKLYAYTNDKNGIRHAIMEESNIDADDAKYFLLSCTSFINYLKTKI